MKQLKGLLATAKWWYFFLTYARFLSRNSPSVLKRGGGEAPSVLAKKSDSLLPASSVPVQRF